MSEADIIFPQNQPTVGRVNYQPSPPGAATGRANYASSPTGPVIGNELPHTVTAAVPAVGRAVKNPDPYNTQVPATALPNRVPFPTPIGVSPHFETPTETWTYDYGNGGGY